MVTFRGLTNSIANLVAVCGRSAMNIALTTYLQYASDTKYQILTTGWAGFGVAIISNSTRLTAYWFLVLTILGLGIATAWYEDFPGAIEKPNPVCILDMVAHVTEFVLEVCHAWAPRLCNIFQFVSLAGGSGWRIGRAFLISKKVPKTPITSRRDWFNTFGLAVLHGVKWAFGLMAWPATAIPLTGHGEPFAQVQGTGKWLTREERRQLLAVVHSSEYIPEPEKQFLCDILMWISGPLPVARLPLPDAIIDP